MTTEYSNQNPPNVGDQVTVIHQGGVMSHPWTGTTHTVVKVSKIQYVLDDGNRYSRARLPRVHQIGRGDGNALLWAADDPRIPGMRRHENMRAKFRDIRAAAERVIHQDNRNPDAIDLDELDAAIAAFRAARDATGADDA